MKILSIYRNLAGLRGLIVALAVALISTAAAAGAGDLRDGDIPLGAEDAPITVIEYASMTCPHCATFHNTVFPAIKKKYIDKGVVRFIFREYPLDGLALRASMLARCAGKDKFYAFLKVLFHQQRSWATAPDPMAALAKIARFGGMSDADFQACMKNQELSRKIVGTRYDGQKTYGVNATPTFVINGKTRAGVIPINEFDQIVADLVGTK